MSTNSKRNKKNLPNDMPLMEDKKIYQNYQVEMVNILLSAENHYSFHFNLFKPSKGVNVDT